MPTKFDVELALVKLAVFFAPMTAFRLSGFFITISDIIFALVLLIRLANGTVPLRPFHDATKYWYVGAILLGLGLMLSSIVHGAAVDGLVITSQYFFAFLGLTLAITGRPQDEAISLVKVGAWSLTIICAVGILAYFYGLRSFGHAHILITGSGRVASLVDNPNGLAQVIALYIPLVMFLTSIKNLSIKLSTILFAISVSAVILSGSNSGLISMILTILVFLVVQGNMKQLFLYITTGAILVFTIIRWGEHFLPEAFQNRVLSAVLSGNASEAGTFDFRMALIREAIGKLDNNLIIGLGANQYRPTSELGLHVHNTYLLLTNEGSLTALVGLMIILGTAALIGFSCVRERDGRMTAAAILAVVVSIALLMMSNTHIYARFIFVPLLLLLGVATARVSGGSSAPAGSSWVGYRS